MLDVLGSKFGQCGTMDGTILGTMHYVGLFMLPVT